MSVIATQFPNIQASFVRAGLIGTSSNIHSSAERHNSGLKTSLAFTTVNKTTMIRDAQLFRPSRFDQRWMRNQPLMPVCR